MKRLLLISAFLLPLNLFGGWTLQESGVDGTLRDVHFVDTSHGWIAAGSEGNKGLILRTTNGGGNWKIEYIEPSHADRDLIFTTIEFTDTLEGWVGGYEDWYDTTIHPNPAHYACPILLHSIDGSSTWQGKQLMSSYKCPICCHLEKVVDICIIDSSCGFYMINGYNLSTAFFYHWEIIKSLDGIHEWDSGHCGYKGIAIHFVDSLRGWFLTRDFDNPTRLFYTEKGVESLSVIYNLPSFPFWGLADMDFVDTLHGWIVGDTNIIYHTTNGGTTWVEQTNGVTSNLYAVDFVDSLNGWVAGNNGTIIRTRDGGNNWINESTPISSKINSICFIDTSNGWAVGDSGKILHYTSYGVEESEKLKIESVKLMIEPNPFRNYAIINYELPVGSKVSLKIYDVMGRVVKVLVDEEVFSGYHKVEWNAREFPSGIYFASFVAPNYKTSKKLILTK